MGYMKRIQRKMTKNHSLSQRELWYLSEKLTPRWSLSLTEACRDFSEQFSSFIACIVEMSSIFTKGDLP